MTKLAVASDSQLGGLTFSFDNDQNLDPGQQAVLVGNREAFAMRYPAQVAHVFGEFAGKLRDSGESIALPPLEPIRFDDSEPWPTSADGQGYSLERTDTNATADASDPEHWRASAQIGGTPGSHGQATDTGSIIDHLKDPDGDQRVNLIEYVLESLLEYFFATVRKCLVTGRCY